VAGSSSPYNCTCIASYYGAHGGLNNCTLCIDNYYCPPDTIEPYTCGQGSSSPAGSSEATNCSCIPSYYGVNGADTCHPCTAGHYCPGGDLFIECPSMYYCPANSSAPLSCGIGGTSFDGSFVATNCSCIPGMLLIVIRSFILCVSFMHDTI
jgi:hypothetical protein